MSSLPGWLSSAKRVSDQLSNRPTTPYATQNSAGSTNTKTIAMNKAPSMSPIVSPAPPGFHQAMARVSWGSLSDGFCSGFPSTSALASGQLLDYFGQVEGYQVGRRSDRQVLASSDAR